MPVLTVQPSPHHTTEVASLAEIKREIVVKRAEDALRFRTCCADPRASK